MFITTLTAESAEASITVMVLARGLVVAKHCDIPPATNTEAAASLINNAVSLTL
jgi:hypothetical protein